MVIVLPNFNGFQQNQTQPTFYFYDLNTKFSYKPSDKDIISISIYNGEDNLDSSRENQNTFGSGTEERIINSDIEDLLNWGNWGQVSDGQDNGVINYTQMLLALIPITLVREKE